MSSVDPSSVTASVVAELVKASFNATVRGASGAVRSTWSKIFEDFAPYMEDTYSRNRNVRILCKKDSDVDLYDVYVHSSFSSGDKKISDREVIEHFTGGKNIIVNGNGGAGKTFFMRHLWLTIFANPGSTTPIFIELRQLSDLSKLDLKTFIRRTISNHRELTDDLFDYFCAQGRFSFLLDGFDEVAQEHREELQRQILLLSSIYSKCSFAVSSRFEKRFAGWQNFDIFESAPFDLGQVRALITKVPFDADSKVVFLKKLTAEFFSQNRSFLSNPLLSIMMMMTFRENMDIPRRMSIFYDQDFNTLFQWHDATKAYSRYKTLDIEDFQKSFGVFCLLSYYKQVFEFTKSEIIEYISMSSKFCSFSQAPEDILEDYEESVNLIKQDGLKYTFIHRSFQEYFASYALVRIVPDKFAEFVGEIGKRTSDSIIAMCFEMNPRLVVQHYIRPEIHRFDERKTFTVKRSEPFYFLNRTGAEYHYMISYPKDGNLRRGKSVTGGVSMNMSEEFSFFIENVGRLMGKRPSSPMKNYSRDLLFERGMFNIFRPIKDIGPSQSATVRVTFGPNKIEPSVEFDDPLPIGATQIEDHVAREVDGSRECFAKVETRIRTEMKGMEAWCRNEIAKAEKGGRSLNEILGIN
ncbi:NACHT domain-containing protein [Mesorhizobium sp. M7A.F.Ca.ET.027.02.1.1]|uniref:NACHT domain-containing protein n=1 Tax=Mesorhizobium sp. M7A.F.Ca.ET.027.02.1.1 TaxID=2496655 RepID=UPI00167B0997|nr:NACHT domain-containing protein [Mesorhizobium sp. M7A.F.Ca.ET.027.02.1.1]